MFHTSEGFWFSPRKRSSLHIEIFINIPIVAWLLLLRLRSLSSSCNWLKSLPGLNLDSFASRRHPQLSSIASNLRPYHMDPNQPPRRRVRSPDEDQATAADAEPTTFPEALSPSQMLIATGFVDIYEALTPRQISVIGSSGLQSGQDRR